MKQKIINPHDKFFKEVFSRKENAAEFIENYLPEHIVRLFDLDSLEFTKDTFIDARLREYFSDLLFKADLKDGSYGYLYLLFEHKSYLEPLIAFDILRYMVKIWEAHLKTSKILFFPMIIPIIVYHGESKWKIGKNFRSLFEFSEETFCFIPDFEYLIWDASDYSDEEIRGRAVLQVALLILKHIFKKDLNEHLPRIFSLLKEISDKRTGLEYIEAIVRYIFSAAPKENISREEIMKTLKQELSDKGDMIMATLADSFREEGMIKGIQQGIQQGMQKAMQQAIIDNLEAKFDVVPRTVVREIEAIQEPAVLKMLHKKSAVAESLDQFREILSKILD